MTSSHKCCVLSNSSCCQLMMHIPHTSSPVAPSKQNQSPPFVPVLRGSVWLKSRKRRWQLLLSGSPFGKCLVMLFIEPWIASSPLGRPSQSLRASHRGHRGKRWRADEHITIHFSVRFTKMKHLNWRRRWNQPHVDTICAYYYIYAPNTRDGSLPDDAVTSFNVFWS